MSDSSIKFYKRELIKLQEKQKLHENRPLKYKESPENRWFEEWVRNELEIKMCEHIIQNYGKD